MLTVGLRVLMFCERANHSFKETNPRSEGANSRYKNTTFM